MILHCLAKQTSYRRVINGDIAKPGQFPYFVLLDILKLDGSISFCGGGLINPRFVITAAHCMINAIGVECYFPIVDENDPRLTMHVQAEKIIVHDHFISSTLRNDIALLKLPPHQMGTTEPIVLEPPNEDESFEGEVAEIAGIGIYNTDGFYSEVLRYYYPVVTNLRECKNIYANQLWNRVRDTNICAMMQPNQGLVQGTCFGDSGGPLVLVRDGLHILIGIVSYGPPHCETNVPHVFTRVNAYTDWIAKKINEN